MRFSFQTNMEYSCSINMDMKSLFLSDFTQLIEHLLGINPSLTSGVL